MPARMNTPSRYSTRLNATGAHSSNIRARIGFQIDALTTENEVVYENEPNVFSKENSFEAAPEIDSNSSINGSKPIFFIFRSVVPASGVISRPQMSDILCQWRSRIPGLHNMDISGTSFLNSLISSMTFAHNVNITFLSLSFSGSDSSILDRGFSFKRAR